MKSKRIFHLTTTALFLLLIGALPSCIEIDDNLGSTLLPNSEKYSLERMTFSLPVQNRVSDSLQTHRASYLTVGALTDSDLGETKASSLFLLTPSTRGHSFGDAPEAISLKMYISVDSQTLLKEEDQHLPQNFRVHQLLKELDSTDIYSNSISLDEIRGERVDIGGSLFFGGDSLSIDLSNNFAEQLLSATDQEMDSLALLSRKIKGLVLEADAKPAGESGGRINLISPQEIYFLLYYRHKDSKENIDKDSSFIYFITDATPRVNIYNHHSEQLQKEEPTELIYFEGLAGVKPYIDFAIVKEEIESWCNSNSIDINKIVIAKAEIKLPFEYPLDYKELNNYPTQVSLVSKATRANGERSYNLIESSSGGESGSINRSLKEYPLNITSYLQKVLQGKIAEEALKTFMVPTFQTSDQYSGATYQYIQNYQYSKAVLNGNLNERGPTLVITYAVTP